MKMFYRAQKLTYRIFYETIRVRFWRLALFYFLIYAFLDLFIYLFITEHVRVIMKEVLAGRPYNAVCFQHISQKKINNAKLNMKDE